MIEAEILKYIQNNKTLNNLLTGLSAQQMDKIIASSFPKNIERELLKAAKKKSNIDKNKKKRERKKK